jgi:SEC-C motif-containing protein
MAQTGPRQRGTRIMLPSKPGDPYYCFLIIPARGTGESESDYREVRRSLLVMLCHVTKLKFPNALDVIGLATENRFAGDSRSEDALYLDARNWDSQLDNEARDWQQKFGLLVDVRESRSVVSEFPVTVSPPGPNPLNKACPCGSGKKWKHCHGQ